MRVRTLQRLDKNLYELYERTSRYMLSYYHITLVQSQEHLLSQLLRQYFHLPVAIPHRQAWQVVKRKSVDATTVQMDWFKTPIMLSV